MKKTFAIEDFIKWGSMGAAITNSPNSSYTPEKRSKAAKKAWRNRRNKAKKGSK